MPYVRYKGTTSSLLDTLNKIEYTKMKDRKTNIIILNEKA